MGWNETRVRLSERGALPSEVSDPHALPVYWFHRARDLGSHSIGGLRGFGGVISLVSQRCHDVVFHALHHRALNSERVVCTRDMAVMFTLAEASHIGGGGGGGGGGNGRGCGCLTIWICRFARSSAETVESMCFWSPLGEVVSRWRRMMSLLSCRPSAWCW